MKTSRILIISLLFFSNAAWTKNSATLAFQAGSLDQILHVRNGKPFVLTLWSLECATCMKELDAIAESLKKHPDLDLVMVSTDDSSQADAVQAVLGKHGLGKIESWTFGDANAQKLRYEIDPSWFGELPRSYFFDAAHQRSSQSGALTAEALTEWYKHNH